MRPDPAATRTPPRPRPVPARAAGAAGSRPDRDLSRPLPAALGWSVLALFAVALAGTVLLLDLPRWLPAWYLATSTVAFAAYGVDKSAARRAASRVSEQTLLFLGVAGGWPGALVAQQLFRHKTRKRSFRRVFWASVVANVVALAAVVVLLIAPGAMDGVTDLLGGFGAVEG